MFINHQFPERFSKSDGTFATTAIHNEYRWFIGIEGMDRNQSL